MGVIGSLAIAQPITLNRVGQNNRRLALAGYSLRIGCIHLIGVVTTAVKRHNLVIGHILDQLQQFRVLAEEVLSGIGAAIGLVVLQITVTDFIHTLDQHTALIFLQQRIPVSTPDNLDHIPASTAENTFELLNNLAIAANRAIKALQVAINHKNQVLKPFATGQ